jgi:hypothetical protein
MLVDEFVEAIAVGLERRSQSPGQDIWPHPYADFTLAHDISGNAILDILEQIYDVCSDGKKIANFFYRPSRVVYLMYLFSAKVKNSNSEVKKRVALAENMLSTISILRNRDTFVKSGSNIVYSDYSELDKFNIHKFSDQNLVLLLRKIIAALSTLTEYCYFAWMGAGREVHGVYKHNNSNYLVRDFYDLQLPHWEFTKKLPWKSISVLTDEGDSNQRFDFNGRLYYDPLKRTETLKAALTMDGVQVDFSYKELDDIYSTIFAVLCEAKEYSRKLSGNELLLQYVRSQFYALNPVITGFNLDIDISVPDYIVKSILTASGTSSFKKMTDKLKNCKTLEERLVLIKQQVDPRNTFIEED